MTIILVFGDSIVYGAWDKEGGWVQRLRKWLDEKIIASGYKEHLIIHNLGVGGDTSGDLLKRFESEVNARLLPDEDIIIIISIGGNDAILNNKTGKLKCSPDRFKDNMHNIVISAKKYSKNIIFVGGDPVDESKVDPIPWYPGFSYKKENIDLLAKIAEDICNDEKIPYINIFDSLGGHDAKNFLVDGIHPNTEGHEKIFKAVKKYIEDNNLI